MTAALLSTCPTVQNHKSWRKGVKMCDGNDSISGQDTKALKP